MHFQSGNLYFDKIKNLGAMIDVNIDFKSTWTISVRKRQIPASAQCG